MKQTLYKLTEQYNTIINMFDKSITDEDKEHALEILKGVQDQFEDKVENIAKIVIEAKDSIEIIKLEEKRLYERRQAMQNTMEWLKNYLLTEMVSTNIYKVKRDVLTVSVQDNPPSCEVESIEAIPPEYIRIIPEQREADKKAIIEHFKETGEIVNGVDIIINKKHVSIR